MLARHSEAYSLSRRRRYAETTPAKSVDFDWRRSAKIALLAVVSVGVSAYFVWAFRPAAADAAAPVYRYKIVKRYPHDSKAYCQGLCVDRGKLYEGTGQYGFSEVRLVNLETGRPEKRVPLDRRYFGEGITVWGNYIIQLTWKAGLAIVYDKATFKPVGSFPYQGEGWGITHDGRNLIVSDGTSRLRFFDPKTFKVARQLTVRLNGRPRDQLNELEYINGEIWANVWHEDYIVRIDPKTGNVNSVVDLRGLLRRLPHQEAVLNGIAYDKENDRLFVTGKHWPSLFEIELVEPR